MPLTREFPKFESIHTIAIPIPSIPDLITANVYAVGNGPVTLIDTGPKVSGSLEILVEQMKLGGFDIGDVERMIITHGHLDHFGLAGRIREAVGHPVECFIHAEDKWRVSSDNFKEEVWSEGMDNLMTMVQMPLEEMQRMRERFSFFKELCDPLDEISTVEDGDEFVGDGYHLKVIHTPGHTPGGVCLYEFQEKVLFSGDHIIKHITPNPLMELNPDRLRDSNYQSLEAYINSLEKLRELNVNFVFPGHGEYIEDLQGIISAYITHHQERKERVWKALQKKMRPLYQLIDDVFPFVPEDDIFLAISEIIVHLEILVREGRAELADPGPPLLYRAL